MLSVAFTMGFTKRAFHTASNRWLMRQWSRFSFFFFFSFFFLFFLFSLFSSWRIHASRVDFLAIPLPLAARLNACLWSIRAVSRSVV